MKEVNIYRPMLDYSANESYKSLRTNLLFCGEEKKVIAITSCTPNEGKSTVSLNLALSLADSGKKVLLIDADLRKSVLLGRTEVDQEIKGLSHLLSHQETIENVIYATNIPRFNIIYAGTVPPNPAELLGAEYFKRVLAAVKKVYDYIIIDTPPLGSVIDSAVIADECDGSIIVMEQMTYAEALPLFGLRQNVYTDPQKPMKVEPGIYPLNGADENSLVVTTVDFALTYFVVSGELERSGVPLNLVINDAGGLSVLTSWAAGKFSSTSISEYIKEEVEPKVKCRKLVIPGKVAVLKGDLEAKLPGWEIIVGPREAVQLVKFLKDMQA